MTDGSSTRRGLLGGIGLAAATGGLAAQPAALPGAGASGARANSGTVGLITGGVEGTYIRIAADLASVLDDGERLRVLPIIGKGSMQNLFDIVYLRGVDIGIVQSDVLASVLRDNLLPGVTQAVNYICKLYDEEVHILARPDITRVEDLAGKKVNIDVRGSGTAMTASLVFNKLQVAIQPTYDSQANALRRLQDGDVSALVYVAGSPASLFASIGGDSGLHFLAIPANSALIETYLPAQLAHETYPALVAQGSSVETLAVGAVMAVFNWQPGSEPHAKVARFIGALSDKFVQLQKPPRHPKWRDVNLAAQVPGWMRFASASDLRAPGQDAPLLRR